MAHLHSSIVTLRISGDLLVPEILSELLCCMPTHSFIKGQIFRGPKTGQEIIKKTGMWSLESADAEPGNIDKQVAELLGKLTSDLNTWASLSKQFKIDLFCGLFMDQSNEGLSVSAETILALGQRRIILEIDIYAPTQDIKDDDPCPCRSGKLYSECCGGSAKRKA
ncbi:MAG: DUF4279 domain-containing protein [Acetobacterium woodii]|nr:DUF4279 domain-containing protein [Acetobacterium woodii]